MRRYDPLAANEPFFQAHHLLRPFLFQKYLYHIPLETSPSSNKHFLNTASSLIPTQDTELHGHRVKVQVESMQAGPQQVKSIAHR